MVGGVELGQLGRDWGALLPTQLALPRELLLYRHLRRELLFRARQVAEAPSPSGDDAATQQAYQAAAQVISIAESLFRTLIDAVRR